jgi:hypothetical protein
MAVSFYSRFMFFTVVSGGREYRTNHVVPGFHEQTRRQQLSFVSAGKLMTLDTESIDGIELNSVAFPSPSCCPNCNHVAA